MRESQKELVNRKAAGKAGECRSELMKPPRQVFQSVKHGHCFCLACECDYVCVCVCLYFYACILLAFVYSLEAVDEPFRHQTHPKTSSLE